MKKLLLMAILLVSSTYSFAATLTLDATNQLLGATGVDVNGSLYDVEFIDGSAKNIYYDGTTWNFTFTNQTDAENAAQALLDQVLLGVYDNDPSLTFGLTYSDIYNNGYSTYGHIFTPYAFDLTSYDTTTSEYSSLYSISAMNYNVELWDDVYGPWWTSIYNDYSVPSTTVYDVPGDLRGRVVDTEVYAVWSTSEVAPPTNGEGDITPVPEPSTFLLLGGGLAGLALVARRRKKE